MAAGPLRSPSRDSLTSVNEDGSRYFIHPSDVRGYFSRFRRLFGWILIVFFALLPWIPVNGHPAVFLDIASGQFHLFGLTLVAQDLYLLFFLISGLGFSLFFITALLGRVWCGWACPQTVFLDAIFRRIERLIDGDAPARRQLERAPMGVVKLFKRVLKHSLYLILSLGVAHIFMSYFVSLPRLYDMMHHSPAENWFIFLFVFGFGGILYFNFAWFREQFCIILCPYGRFQSALMDDHTINVGYDENRGEPRGKATDPDAGDCIDCRRCVQVCPTGIDIRQGLQMECIACTQCIDACDEIMTKLKRPTGLIRYDSERGLKGEKTRLVRPRILIYTVLLLIGACVLGAALSQVRPATVSVSRLTGSPYYLNDGNVRNNYMVRIDNKRSQDQDFRVRINADNIPIQQNGLIESVTVPAHDHIEQTLIVQVPRDDYPGQFDLQVIFEFAESGQTLKKKIRFLGPDMYGQ